MCLVLRSDQHIQLKFVHEQMWPRSDGNELIYSECFDIILRSFSDKPIEHLFALSPFDGEFKSPSTDPSFGWAHTPYDWILTKNPVRLPPNTASIYKLHFRAEELPDQNRFKATRLKPVVADPNWFKSAPPKQIAAASGTGITLKDITFENGQVIEPFDAAREAETTYWIRLEFEGKPANPGTPAIFGEKTNPLFRVRPCRIFSPEEVVSDLTTKFDALAQTSHIGKHANNAKSEVIDRSLRIPGSSVQICDHRISVVTGQHGVLVFNTYHEGACSFFAVEEIQDGTNDGYFARNYFTGAEYFPNTDALTLARNALDYLRRYATTDLTAKTKEEVTSAISGHHHPNVAHVVDVLKENDFITETGKDSGRFYANQAQKHRQLETPADAGADMLSRLYETVTETKNGRRGFSPRGYRIDFDLAFD